MTFAPVTQTTVEPPHQQCFSSCEIEQDRQNWRMILSTEVGGRAAAEKERLGEGGIVRGGRAGRGWRKGDDKTPL